MRIVLSILLLVMSLSLTAQNDTVNRTDGQGRKTGYWISRDPQGNKVYEGYFREGQPFGKFLRFHPNGRVRAEMNYQNGGRVDAKLFDPEGHTIAEGVYSDKLKDGPWTFYAGTGKPLFRILYSQGRLNGEARRYNPDGTLLEETHWKDNVLEGLQIIHYPDGKPQAQISYRNGVMEGPYELFFPDGSPEVAGNYRDGLKEGSWIYRKPDGSVDFTLKYRQGKLLNPEILDARQKAAFDQYEKNRLNLKDPQDFIQNPEELLRR